MSTTTHRPATEPALAAKDRATVCELTCDLSVIAHRLRDLRRWTPATATGHIDRALAGIDAALDSLTAEYHTRAH